MEIQGEEKVTVNQVTLTHETGHKDTESDCDGWTLVKNKHSKLL